jgi:hypothetical protein
VTPSGEVQVEKIIPKDIDPKKLIKTIQVLQAEIEKAEESNMLLKKKEREEFEEGRIAELEGLLKEKKHLFSMLETHKEKLKLGNIALKSQNKTLGIT